MAGRILIPIVTAFQSQGIKDAVGQLDKLGKKMSTTASIGSTLGRSLSVGAIGAGAFSFFKGAITEARDYERGLKALETIFGSSAPVMQEFSKNASSIGLSTTQAAKASTFLGSVLKQSGMPMGDVITNTQDLVGLASDLATVYNYDVSEALTGMTALFRGEYDPIEKFGVAMKQAEVNALLLERGQSKLTGQAKAYAMQMARLDLFMSRAGDSVGAFARGQGTLFVEQQNLNVAFKNMQAVIAQAVIPPLAKLMGILSRLLQDNETALIGMFEDLAVVAEEFVNALVKNSDDIKSIVGLMGDIFTLAKDGTIFLMRYGKAIVSIVIGFKAAQIVMKAWVALQPAIAAATYLSQGAMVALGYAADLAKVKVAAATLGLSLLVAGLVEMGMQISDHQDKMADLNSQLEKYGYTSDEILDALPLWGAHTVAVEDLADAIKYLESRAAQYHDRTRLREKAKKAQDERATTAAREQAAATEEFMKKLAEFRKKMQELLQNIIPASFVTRELGAFEKAVVDGFEAIYDQVDQGVSDKLLTSGAGKALKAYAKLVRTELQDIASQRDKLAKKFQLGKALIADTKNAVIQFANLASIMSNVSEDVVRTTSFMVGQIQVTTTETVKSVANAETIINKFRDIVGATKNFAANLTVLKNMNISSELYNQILAGGLEQGAAIAEALVAGGQGAVDTLNGLFGELSKVGGGLGEEAAQVMYGAGVDLSDGLIAGLLSADEKLKQAATTLANTFRNTFNKGISSTGVTSGFTAPKVDTGYAETAIKASGASASSPRVFNLTVNAGVGTDGPAVGKQIVDLIQKYERTSGKIYARAY